jgi:hypothetical protein
VWSKTSKSTVFAAMEKNPGSKRKGDLTLSHPHTKRNVFFLGVTTDLMSKGSGIIEENGTAESIPQVVGSLK